MAKGLNNKKKRTLINSFSKTNLDLENPLPQGGPINYPLPTYISPNATGTPTRTANPGPFKGFSQLYTPQNPYLNSVSNKAVKTSMLSANIDNPAVLSITNLDNSEPGVNGGVPYKTVDDPTVYPSSTKASSPVRGYFAEPGVAAQKYGSNTQVYSSTNTYMEFIDPYTKK
jgi:hypothetical protein